MIYIKEITLIIENIPNLLQYYVPGYWTILIFRYLGSKKVSNSIMNIMSCVISYVFISVIALLRVLIELPFSVPNTPIINSSIAIILGTFFAIIVALIFSCKWFSKLTVWLFHKTPNEDIWRDVLDLRNGSNLKIYIKDADYYVIGHHKNHEEKDGDSWLAVSAFAKFHKTSNTPYRNEPSYLNDKNVIYTIRFSDIEHIEIF